MLLWKNISRIYWHKWYHISFVPEMNLMCSWCDTNVLFKILAEKGIAIADMRGQSYFNNGDNMKIINKSIVMDLRVEPLKVFFSMKILFVIFFKKKIYMFCCALTHQWQVLKQHLGHLMKQLSAINQNSHAEIKTL